MTIEPGQIVGSYEVIASLGSGGMGDVYRARDLRLGRQVAIKFVSSQHLGQPDAEARLDREARLASALNHPGIVTVYDVGRHENQPYVVMELIEGRPLTALLADGRLPIREGIDIAAQVADALAAAHEAGIIHRDLKPQNIMITAAGRAKVVDFGLSKITISNTEETLAGNAITGEHAVIGTVGYMAPEQVLGLPADPRSDQFALGTILYEMLTGKRAFRRDSTVQTMSSILEDEPPPIASVRPDVPAAVVSVGARCLAKRPERRYASTRDLAHDLRDAHEELLLESRSGQRFRRPPAATGRWIVGAAAVAALALAAGALIWSRPGSAPVSQAGAPSATMRYIVVMPFTNVTKNLDDQVFADGLTETLTSTLTQLERYQRLLRVVPATEVRAVRAESVRDARQAFGATLAITGSIQRQPSAVRLTLNLVDAVQLVQLASRTIDVELDHEILTQDTITGAATQLLTLELEPGERLALTAGGTSAASAYESFVQGRGHLYRFDRGPEHIDRAIEALERAVAADTRYALAHTALAEAYWRKYEATRDASLIERAVNHCEQALAIDSRLAPVHITLAMLARGRGRYEEAVAVAQRAIELDPVNSEAFRELGRAQEALGRFPDAEATYRRAIESRPDDWLAYNTLGSFYAARSRWVEAEAAFARVVELTPDNTRGHNNLGVASFRQGRDDDAARAWERSIAIRPTFSAASNLGTYYFQRQRFTDAARAFERAVALAPNDLRVWRNLGAALYWAPGERNKANDAFARVVQLAEAERKVNPRQPALLAQLADAHAMLGARADALAAAAAAERLGVADGETAFVLAAMYEQLGDRAAAFTWLRTAIGKGYPHDTIERSPSLAELRKDPRYRTLIAQKAEP